VDYNQQTGSAKRPTLREWSVMNSVKRVNRQR
jgi:hypothetical protein